MRNRGDLGSSMNLKVLIYIRNSLIARKGQKQEPLPLLLLNFWSNMTSGDHTAPGNSDFLQRSTSRCKVTSRLSQKLNLLGRMDSQTRRTPAFIFVLLTLSPLR